MSDFDLTENEIALLMSAFMKITVLSEYTKHGITLTLTDKNFGYPELTIDDEERIMDKLDKLAKIAWLKEQR